MSVCPLACRLGHACLFVCIVSLLGSMVASGFVCFWSCGLATCLCCFLAILPLVHHYVVSLFLSGLLPRVFFFLMRCFPSRSPPRRGGNPHLVPLEGVLEALSVVLVLVLVLLASPAGSYKLGFGSDFSLYLLVFVLQMPFLIGLQSIIVFAK